uniref:intestinal mucin-like protein n=1 Tax=Myxine glutinosa TaxID=7769 RepID=UPI00358E377A
MPVTTVPVPPTLPPVSQTTAPPATPPAGCYCQLPGGEILRPGDVIYNSTIVNGLCRIAKCNENCQVTASQVPCMTTPKPAVSTAPPPAPPTIGTPAADCIELAPARMAGETWTENCNTYTCIGNGKEVSVTPKSCPDVVEPPCASGKKATKVLDADGCCFHWQCGCSCISTENSQMKTFDGVIFDYPGNFCSYILVQEIDSVFDLSVEMNNYYCDARTTVCSGGLTINFRGNSIKALILSSGETQFQKNQEDILKMPFNEDSFVGFVKNNAYYINIPEIKASVMLMGKSFSIDLPYAVFNGNTEGLCGTCTNSTAEDCVWRDGSVENEDCCTNTAMDWLVPDINKAGCLLALPEEYRFCVPPPTPLPSCTRPEGQYCELIRNEAFSECMGKINVDFFLQGCQLNPCVDETEHLCELLKTAAFACGAEGICVDWLPLAEFCAYECPPDMVHRPCRAMPVNICGTSSVPTNEVVPEGCFCAGDKKQLNTTSDICVDECPECYSSDGTPKVADERWTEGCSMCTCNPGQKTTCEITPCPIPSLNCPFDLSPVVTLPQKGECCPDYKCPTCIHEGVTYQPGDRWTDPSSNCTHYYCNPFSTVVSISESTTVCGPVDTLNCTGPIMYDSSGCCPISCLPISEKCQPMQIEKVLQDDLCTTSSPVTLQECNGFCSSRSSYDVTMGRISHMCNCCKERDVEERSATLKCPNGTVMTKSYIYIKSCTCSPC